MLPAFTGKDPPLNESSFLLGRTSFRNFILQNLFLRYVFRLRVCQPRPGIHLNRLGTLSSNAGFDTHDHGA